MPCGVACRAAQQQHLRSCWIVVVSHHSKCACGRMGKYDLHKGIPPLGLSCSYDTLEQAHTLLLRAFTSVVVSHDVPTSATLIWCVMVVSASMLTQVAQQFPQSMHLLLEERFPMNCQIGDPKQSVKAEFVKRIAGRG